MATEKFAVFASVDLIQYKVLNFWAGFGRDQQFFVGGPKLCKSGQVVRQSTRWVYWEIWTASPWMGSANSRAKPS